MKILDEKGKVFGKINLIDFLALVVIVAAVLILAVRLFLPSGDKKQVKGPNQDLTYTVLVSAVDQDTYKEVIRQLENYGGRDQLMANNEMVDAYITKVEATPHVAYNVTDLGQVVRDVEDYEGGRLDLLFTIEAEDVDSISNLVGTQEVRVAKAHILKTVHIEFPYSVIMSCEWSERTSESKS